MKQTSCYIILSIFIGFFLFSQQAIAQKKINGNNSFARWLISPKLAPYLPILNHQYDLQDTKIKIEKDAGVSVGTRLERYFPNSGKGFGIEGDYLHQERIFNRQGRYLLEEHSFSVLPFFSIKQGKVEKNIHPFMSAGVKTQFTTKNTITYSATQNEIKKTEADFIKKIKLWGYVGFGIHQDKFNQSIRQASLSTLSFDIFFPLFNQAYTFKNKNSEFQNTFDLFKKNRSSIIYFSFNYKQNLNFFYQKSTTKYFVPSELILQRGSATKKQQIKRDTAQWQAPKNKLERWLPPIVYFGKPRHNIFANPYISTEISNRLDSIYIDQNNRQLFKLKQSGLRTFRIGYSIHLGFNYRDFVTKDGKVVQTNNDNGIRGDIYLSGGILYRSHKLQASRTARMYSLDWETSAGGRIGFDRLGIYLTGGITYSFNINKEFFYANQSATNNFNFSELKQHYFYVGIGFNNAVWFKVNFYQLKQIQQLRPSGKLHPGFSIGFGL